MFRAQREAEQRRACVVHVVCQSLRTPVVCLSSCPSVVLSLSPSLVHAVRAHVVVHAAVHLVLFNDACTHRRTCRTVLLFFRRPCHCTVVAVSVPVVLDFT